MKKKILLRSLLGAPIGVTISLIITIIISLCSGHGEYFPTPQALIDWCGNETTAVIVQMICSLVFGAICSGSSVIWDMEKWSLTKQILIHFAVIVISGIPISYVLNWMPHNLYGALSYVATFIIVYILIGVSIYFSIKAKIKKMNKQLQEIQQDDQKEE